MLHNLGTNDGIKSIRLQSVLAGFHFIGDEMSAATAREWLLRPIYMALT